MALTMWGVQKAKMWRGKQAVPQIQCAEGRAYQLSQKGAVLEIPRLWSQAEPHPRARRTMLVKCLLDIINLSDKPGKAPGNPQEIFYPYSVYGNTSWQRKMETKEWKGQSKCVVHVHARTRTLMCTGAYAYVCPLEPEEDTGHPALPTILCPSPLKWCTSMCLKLTTGVRLQAIALLALACCCFPLWGYRHAQRRLFFFFFYVGFRDAYSGPHCLCCEHC